MQKDMGEKITLDTIAFENEFSNLEHADDRGKPIEFEWIIPAVNWNATLWEEASFEGRKKRPYEKGRKKRRKGTRTPSPLFS